VVYDDGMDKQPIADARSNLSEIVNRVRIGRTAVLLTRRGKPQAVIVPPEFAEFIESAGGADKLLAYIRDDWTAAR
jgi:prevent-host-death family protein